MSSREFSADLVPEPRLRNLVMLSGAIAALAGFALIIHMPLNAVMRMVLAVSWIMYCGLELHTRSNAASRVARIGINTRGEIWITGRAGQAVPVELLAGTVVIERLAWLRIRFEDGRKYGELLSGNNLRDIQWHRFQLIWQHRRQTFGRAERS